MKILSALFIGLLTCLSVFAAETYEVQKDDTLAKILVSKEYGADYVEVLPFINQIKQLNAELFDDGNLNRIYPGSIINLPDNPNLAVPQPEPIPEPEPEPVPEPEPEPVPEPEPEPEPIPVIGELILDKGSAFIVRDGVEINIQQTFDLINDDLISTRSNSLAQIQLTDNTEFRMGPESSLKVGNYQLISTSLKPSQPEGSMVAVLSRGVIRTITGLLGRLDSNNYKVTSALSATIGVRGTDFTVRSCTNKPSCGDLFGVSVAVQEGAISFANSVEEIELQTNQFTIIQSSTEVPVAAPIPEGYFDLELDAKSIETERSLWQKVQEWFNSIF